MANNNQNILDTIKAIHQVVADSKDFYNGSMEDKDKKKIGLNREVDNPIVQSRPFLDGYDVKILGNKLTLIYHSNVNLESFHDKNFEKKVTLTMENVIDYLKKEYRKLTNETLSLKAIDKSPKILAQSMSRIRSWIQAERTYKIEGYKVDDIRVGSNNKLDASIKNFLEKSTNKKPRNVTIKPSDNQKKK